MSLPELAPIMALAQETLRRCYAEQDPESLRQWMLDQLARLGGGEDDERAVMTWEESFSYYDYLLEQRERDAQLSEDERKILVWPWTSWNKVVDPLEPGMLAVIAAGDGMGKTIYGESIAEHWARHRNRVVFVHYELNRALMMDRRAARHTSITRRELRSGMMTPGQKQRIAEMRPRMTAWDGYITYLHTPGWSMERTVQKLHQLKADGMCDAIVLDYLEKTSASTRQTQIFGSNFYQREADNVEQIKNFAEMTETPTLLIAQMSKAGKSTSIQTVDRTGMRGAGEKSEKANIVAILSREREDDGYSRVVDVLVDKNTLGPSGVAFQQYMEAEYFRVTELERIDLP